MAAIQFEPPAIVHRSQCPGGTIPGNLICHRGQVLSQNVDRLESFHQSQPLGQDAGQTIDIARFTEQRATD